VPSDYKYKHGIHNIIIQNNLKTPELKQINLVASRLIREDCSVFSCLLEFNRADAHSDRPCFNYTYGLKEITNPDNKQIIFEELPGTVRILEYENLSREKVNEIYDCFMMPTESKKGSIIHKVKSYLWTENYSNLYSKSLKDVVRGTLYLLEKYLTCEHDDVLNDFKSAYNFLNTTLNYIIRYSNIWTNDLSSRIMDDYYTEIFNIVKENQDKALSIRKFNVCLGIFALVETNYTERTHFYNYYSKETHLFLQNIYMKDETSTFLKLSTNEKEIYGNAILKAFDKIHNWDFSLNLFRCAIKILFIVHVKNPYSVYQDEKFMKIFTKYSFQLFTNNSVENYMKSMEKPHFLYIAFFTPSFIRISNKEQDLMFSSFQLDTMLFFLKNLVVQRIDKKHYIMLHIHLL
jgi:hypothetical protein